jgi:polar amino acid transport system permease protein
MIRQFGPSEALFIIEALRWTVLLSVVAFIGGGIGGLGVAFARTTPSAWQRDIAAGYIQLFQGTPLLMQLFLVFFGCTVLGAGIDPLAAAAIALTLNAAAFLGEIWRGCIQAVPVGQWEAATALGMRHLARMHYVILPQAGKVGIAPTVGFLVQLVKSTSLASIIGFVEITRAGQIINNVTFRPFEVFGLVAIMYFMLCWPLSHLSQRLERRYGTASRTPARAHRAVRSLGLRQVDADPLHQPDRAS